ncbi:MAG: glucuronate isomerase [Clostridia bacterium]|nr:glucuronate isomerase [Clostridia bacterium]
MKAFLDKDFLLDTVTARVLYHDASEKCPIIDYHCHLSPREIYEDIRYENITQVWLGGDHYKWRLMRSAGVPEKYITGDASDYEKFEKYAEVLGKAIGNPLHHWSHLELRRFFGYDGILNKKTAPEVWKIANEKLQSEGYTSRGLIMMSNVDTICTTDDPIDSLEWHEKLDADKTFPVTVLPAWRPDKAMNLEKETYLDYLAQLEKAADMRIASFEDLKKALHARLDFFAAHNCKLSDHALNYVMYAPATDKEIETIFAARLNGKLPTVQEEAIFKYAFMTFVAGEYHDRGWAMQLHYGCRRDNNPIMFRQMGPDTGFDCVDNYAPSAQTAAFLGALKDADKLPRTILYSLNTNDNAAIDSILGCFQSDEAVGYIQHGSAWWFNDHFDGMSEQLKSLANLGYLAGFIGMLTDSRSFLSYPRHEYFRRILCRIFGQWVEEGFFPDDMETLKEIISDISYGNAKRYFNFAKKEI